MKKLIFSAIAVCGLSGCTAIGFVADMAIIDVLEKDSSVAKEMNDELVFTQIGSEIDAAIIGNIHASNASRELDKKNDTKLTNQFYGVCDRELLEGEKCYSEEYYQQLRKSKKP